MSLIKFKAAAKAVGKPMAQKVDELKVDYKANTTVIGTQTNKERMESWALRLVELAHESKEDPQSFLDAAIIKFAEQKAESEKKDLEIKAQQLAAAQRIVDAATVKAAEELAKKMAEGNVNVTVVTSTTEEPPSTPAPGGGQVYERIPN
jgi:hypothetical protein